MSAVRVASLLLSCAIAVISCISQGEDGDTQPIVIGMFSDLSSTGARDGNDARKGAEIRVREANDAGGINGRAVTLKCLDMKQDPTEAVKCYTTLARELRVCAVIGSRVPNAGIAVSPVADMVKVPVLSLGLDDRATTPEIDPDVPGSIGMVRRYVFLVRPSVSQIASAMAEYAVEHFSLRRYAICADPGSAVSLMQARIFANVVAKAGRVVAVTVDLPREDADFRAAFTRLKEAGAEAVFVCGTAAQNAAFTRAAKEMSYRPTLLGNQEWYAPMREQSVDAAEGAWFAMGVAPDDEALAPLGPPFQAAYGEAPRPEVLAGYQAVGLVLTAVRNAGSSDPEMVRDGLEQATTDASMRAELEIDGKTHRLLDPPVAIMRILEGRYVTVEQRFFPSSGTRSP